MDWESVNLKALVYCGSSYTSSNQGLATCITYVAVEQLYEKVTTVYLTRALEMILWSQFGFAKSLRLEQIVLCSLIHFFVPTEINQ